MKLQSKSGQALVEYTLLLTLVALAAVSTLRGVGQSVNNVLACVNNNLQVTAR